MSIISRAVEFESLRLRFDEEGLTRWWVLFILVRIDWEKGIGQGWVSMVGDVKVGISRMFEVGKMEGDDTSGTPEFHCSFLGQVL